MKVLVTGSSGLIGSELVAHFDVRAREVVGVDNNMRADFFGPAGDTRWKLERLRRTCRNFTHRELGVRNRVGMERLVRAEGPFDLILHCAAQPSHDLAASRPLDDFDVNAVGTMNLLEAMRLCSERILASPRSGEVYNLGGGRDNSCSILEALTRVEEISGKRMSREYVDKNRIGDHICYISDISKLHAHFPGWAITRSLDDILLELVNSWRERLTA